MEFDDPVYGTVAITEDVLQELIRTDPVQRLKQVKQAGPPPHFMDKPVVTRFEHSVGVMALLREHGASLEEQIAGLLHDVPHTAFSHVADFVFETEAHEYHERFMEDIVYDSRIPDVLKRHGLAVDYILDGDNFPLLERDLPDLCADRIDYFLRDATVCGGKDIAAFRDALDTVDDRFVVTDPAIAEDYALTYIWADAELWADPAEVAIFELFARALRRALDTGLLTEQDLFGTDEEVFRALRDADDPEIQDVLATLQGIEITLDPDNPDFHAATKVRYVDPLVVTDDDRFRASDRSERVRERIAEHTEFVGNGYPIRIVS